MARRGQGRTGANPSVGCIIMRNGRVLGRGRTGDGGRPHAETTALSDAVTRYGKDALHGATAYVTLEPCAHYGKTPPCTDALIAAKVARVVAPFSDPDPRVAGNGFAALEAAGITVTIGPGEAEARALLGPYLRMRKNGRATVTLKLATTLDGAIATASGESQWITGPMARRRVHLMRAQSDAILTGGGTVLADDPALDVRLAGMEADSPVPVIADRRLRIPTNARVLAQGNAMIYGDRAAHPEKATALEAAGAVVVQIASDADAPTLLAAIATRGHASIFCEGGATLATALIRADCVDRLVWFTGGIILGGGARQAMDALGINALADAPRFRQVSTETIGPDTMSVWRRVEKD